ncbi:MAG: restriction endonuclease subunit R [Synechococcales cyanobacterium CRU_2_2]|nr:restriction endonuclease subunit R [Synechococcales cyanobacterium CRU_2_2]
MVTRQASKLTLKAVRDRLGYQAKVSQSFDLWLELLPLSLMDQQQIEQLQENFQRYLLDGRVLEGQVRLLAIAPLLQLSGFYDPPNRILVEESIETIQIPQDAVEITGRFDLVVVNPLLERMHGGDFWILVVESKESQIDALAGLPQLLAYAYTSLSNQQRVWGLTTNGVSYRFVLIEAGEVPTYH